ncbi:MAG TPA: DUF1573 domain-containing protein [Planctomycetota bacterium]|nr:DUF1573 domain-containing protein [Planctomycetota bacterium]
MIRPPSLARRGFDGARGALSFRVSGVEAGARLLLGLVILAGTGIAGEAPSGEEEGMPVIEIADPVFNWGKAFKGEQLEHTFTIANRGQKPLVIESLKPNCGCMVPLNEKDLRRMLAPGETTRILLRIDTSILPPGSVKNKYTEVITNAGSGENRLFVEGHVEELLTLEPPHPSVEVVRGLTGPAPPPAVFLMTASAGRRVRLLSLAPEKALLEASHEEIDKGKKFRVSLVQRLKDLKTAFQGENLEAKLEVDGRMIPFRVPVSIVVKDRIDVSPSPSVYFPRKVTEALGKPGEEKPFRVLQVSSIGGPEHSFRITGVRAKDGVFSAAFETLEEGKRYRLTVSLEKRPTKGERILKDTIEVTTDDPELPVLTLRGGAQF